MYGTADSRLLHVPVLTCGLLVRTADDGAFMSVVLVGSWVMVVHGAAASEQGKCDDAEEEDGCDVAMTQAHKRVLESAVI